VVHGDARAVLRPGVGRGPAQRGVDAVGRGRRVLARDHHVAAGDLVVTFYNPRSRQRSWQLDEARLLLLEHRKPDTVVVVGRDVGRAEESLTVTTLAELDPASIDMKCLLIVGAESTRVSPAGVWTPRFVDAG
jgi:precorrin-2 C20-methyltransferase/precorrin-3B C17-methyltransferase